MALRFGQFPAAERRIDSVGDTFFNLALISSVPTSPWTLKMPTISSANFFGLTANVNARLKMKRFAGAKMHQ
jgi:hypothetical protein